MRDVYAECPECGWEGPHDGFSVNEAECGDCHCEFSYRTVTPNGETCHHTQAEGCKGHGDF